MVDHTLSRANARESGWDADTAVGAGVLVVNVSCSPLIPQASAYNAMKVSQHRRPFAARRIGNNLHKANTQQPTPDTNKFDDKRDPSANVTKDRSEAKKSDEMRKADVSDGESP